MTITSVTKALVNGHYHMAITSAKTSVVKNNMTTTSVITLTLIKVDLTSVNITTVDLPSVNNTKMFLAKIQKYYKV